jgi:hypothetical protein
VHHEAVRPRGGWDPFAAAAAVIAAVMVVVYVWLIAQQDSELALWFVAGLVVCALVAAYGSARAAPVRQPALIVSGAALVLLGLLALASIGLPIVVAGVLALVAAARSGRRARVPPA